MRWWPMLILLILLVSGCETVEEVVFGDGGFFDEVIAPTVEQAIDPSSSPSSPSRSTHKQ